MARILVIDDDPGFRRMVCLVLTRAQHIVIEAKDGNEGLIRFKGENPDIVISDIVLPDRQGTLLIREIREISACVRIVAMSGGGGIAGRDYLDTAQKLGANSILLKPFRPADLTKLIDQLTEGSIGPNAIRVI